MIRLKQYKNNILLAFIITIFVILPDLVGNLKWSHYENYDYITFLEIIFTYLLVYIATLFSTIYLLGISFALVLMGFVEVAYYAFFYTYMEVFDWSLLSEAEDIIGSLKSIKLYIIAIVIILTILFAILNYSIKYFNKKTTKNAKYYLLTIIIAYCFLIYNQKNYFPKNDHLSYINISSTLILASLHAVKPEKHKKYKPYKIIKNNHSIPTVIVIMGESLNSTYMNIFGSKYNDTPLLNKLKKYKNFKYFQAISGGVNTEVCIPTFFYIKREPDNIQIIKNNTTNILKLAKNNGYKTYWISTQKEESSTIKMIKDYADIIKTRKDWHKKRLYDDVLIKYLKNVRFEKKTFIVFHLRVNHSPYEDYTPSVYQKFNYKDKNYHEYKVNSYINSILYVDHIIYSIIEYMKVHQKKYVIYFTSDHGEMLGNRLEDWKYGHSQLDINCAKVPFLYYSDKYHKKFNLSFYNHYLISKMIANDIGYNIINPNENGYYYLNCVNIFGDWGYLRYKLNKNNINAINATPIK